MDYAELTDQLEALTLDVREFSHRHHVGVAYVLLSRYSFTDALAKFSAAIHTLATQAGAGDKYNTTITVAFFSVLAERIRTTPRRNVNDFLAKNDDLLDSAIIYQWYSPERLGSAAARTSFLMPDRSPETTAPR